ncbi:MAG: hypothetical protein ACLU4N_03365 [Butyricimonas faecihominis]
MGFERWLNRLSNRNDKLDLWICSPAPFVLENIYFKIAKKYNILMFLMQGVLIIQLPYEEVG